MSDAIMAVSRGVMATLVDGTVRIKIDVEPADAAKAFALMGMPGSPIAIAALALGTPTPSAPAASTHTDTAPEHQKATGGALARLSGMWCGSPDFIDWLADTHPQLFEGALADAEGNIADAAATLVRALCNIESRIELDHDPVAASLFHERIRAPYMAYRDGVAA